MRSPVETRVAIPGRHWRGKPPRPGDRVQFDVAGVGIMAREVVTRAELHRTSERPIQRGECIQVAWRGYIGPYWLLSLRPLGKKGARHATRAG